jgi:hypothetical protein
MKNEQNSTIKVSDETKADLDSLKMIPQEPYDSVLKRLVTLKKQFDKKFN